MTNDTYTECTLCVEVLHDGVWVDMPGFTKREDEFADFQSGYNKLKELATVRAVRRTLTVVSESEVMEMPDAES